MKNRSKKIVFRLFSLILTILLCVYTEALYASESDGSILIKKISQSYTKKFCNSIGFGLSKESAMNFSIREIFSNPGLKYLSNLG